MAEERAEDAAAAAAQGINPNPAHPAAPEQRGGAAAAAAAAGPPRLRSPGGLRAPAARSVAAALAGAAPAPTAPGGGAALRERSGALLGAAGSAAADATGLHLPLPSNDRRLPAGCALLPEAAADSRVPGASPARPPGSEAACAATGPSRPQTAPEVTYAAAHAAGAAGAALASGGGLQASGAAAAAAAHGASGAPPGRPNPGAPWVAAAPAAGAPGRTGMLAGVSGGSAAGERAGWRAAGAEAGSVTAPWEPERNPEASARLSGDRGQTVEGLSPPAATPHAALDPAPSPGERAAPLTRGSGPQPLARAAAGAVAEPPRASQAHAAPAGERAALDPGASPDAPAATPAARRALPALAQIDAGVWAELPESVQRELLQQHDSARGAARGGSPAHARVPADRPLQSPSWRPAGAHVLPCGRSAGKAGLGCRGGAGTCLTAGWAAAEQQVEGHAQAHAAAHAHDMQQLSSLRGVKGLCSGSQPAAYCARAPPAGSAERPDACQAGSSHGGGERPTRTCRVLVHTAWAAPNDRPARRQARAGAVAGRRPQRRRRRRRRRRRTLTVYPRPGRPSWPCRRRRSWSRACWTRCRCRCGASWSAPTVRIIYPSPVTIDKLEHAYAAPLPRAAAAGAPGRPWPAHALTRPACRSAGSWRGREPCEVIRSLCWL